MRQNTFGVVMFVAVMLFASGVAYATTVSHATVYWSADAAACKADPVAIQANAYLITAGSVKHQSGVTGTITLYCTVPLNTDGIAPNQISITYRDSDGNDQIGDDLSYVTARLYRMSTSTGAISGVNNAIVSSNDDNSTTDGVLSSTEDRAPFSETLDYSAYYYYVRIDVVRNQTTDTETIYGVNLDYCESC